MMISSLLRLGRVACDGVEHGWNARSRPDFSDSLMPNHPWWPHDACLDTFGDSGVEYTSYYVVIRAVHIII